MARKGAQIANHLTGESITWLETAADTHGRRLVLDFTVAPGGNLPATHFHPRQSETFVMTSGRFHVWLDGKEQVLGPGDRLVIAPGVPHRWWNAGQEPARMTVTFEPALNTETFLEQFYGLGNAGRTRPDGVPSFPQIMAMARRYELFVAGPPVPVQKLLSIVIGGAARLFGLKAFYPEYSPDGEVRV